VNRTAGIFGREQIERTKIFMSYALRSSPQNRSEARAGHHWQISSEWCKIDSLAAGASVRQMKAKNPEILLARKLSCENEVVFLNCPTNYATIKL